MCSTALANFFISKALEENVPVSNLKLQKLMFIGYGWVGALTDNDMTDGEGFQAWQHGPVLPSVYHQLKHLGNSDISKPITDFDFEDGQLHEPHVKDPVKISILNKVWEGYKNFSAWSLRNMTHEEGSPWSQAFNNLQNTPIDFSNTKTFYLNEIQELVSA